MKRRHAISLALGGLVAQGCRQRRPAEPETPMTSTEETPSPQESPEPEPSPQREGAELTPVTVDPALQIRTITGLRPFRSAGFVVRREDIGGKVLIHNYGHGGGGMSLSWGSSHLALQLAGSFAGSSCAVIGGGVMGLSTARLLQLQGADVTIYTRDLPPATTSNASGAQWWPVSVFDNSRRTEAFSAQYISAANFAFRYFQQLVGPRWGVRWLPNYYLSDSPPTNGWARGVGGVLHPLQIDFQDFGPGEHIFPSRYARRFQTMFIEPSTYLQTLLRDVQSAGAKITVRQFSHASEILQLPQTILFNCSGLGSRDLFGDEELIPVKGHLSVLLPQPTVDYNLITDSFYMFPRSDGIILGGSFERGNWDLTPNPAVNDFILGGHRSIFEQMAHIQQGTR